jgi:hypothetical protein
MVVAVGDTPVLHAERAAQAFVERFEKVVTRGLVEDRDERVEVPVVVGPVAAPPVAAARRLGRVVLLGLVGCGEVDARARLQQVADTSL